MDREYQKYEFCKAVKCSGLKTISGCQVHCPTTKNTCRAHASECREAYDNRLSCVQQGKCTKTAKELHHWLNDNGFRIIKTEGE